MKIDKEDFVMMQKRTYDVLMWEVFTYGLIVGIALSVGWAYL